MPQYRASPHPSAPAELLAGCPLGREAGDLPINDARPYVAYLLNEISAGDQCRAVVDGWKLWDACMAAQAENAKATCPALDSQIQTIKALHARVGV